MPVTPLARFGLFVLDLNTGELSKNGRKLRLQDQSFRVLRQLLEQRGQVVTRERLKGALWSTESFGDFDHGLNAAVAKLRQALGDSAENPRFVETMARYGYRFIAPVVFTDEAAGAVPAPEPLLQSPAGESNKSAPPQSMKVPRLRSVRLPLSVIAASLALVAIAIASFIWLQRKAAPAERIQSVVVLPLENLSTKTEQEYFADGMTAELITELTKIPSLRVISRTTAMRYKHSTKSLKQIARELNVVALVEGEVLQSGSRVRITAKLIEAAAERNLWAETYERDMHDVLDLQGEVAQSIVDTIRTNITSAERARFAVHRSVEPEAYDCYLKGRFFWNKRTEAGLQKSVEYFHMSMQKDPDYALAYSGLADSYVVMAAMGFLPQKDGYAKARAAANNALRLDNALGEAHTVLADLMYEVDWNWRAAEMEFERATKLSPGYATAHQRYSLFLMMMGRTEKSLSEMYRARALDPLSMSINSSLGWRLLWARRYDEAINQLQRTLEMQPDHGRTHLLLGWAYGAKGDSERAVDELRRVAVSDLGSEGIASLGFAHAKAGHTRQAQAIFKQLEERSKRAHVAAYHLATVYAGLGQRDRAFESLIKSCRDRETELVSLKADLQFDGLRSDPRFESLMHCVGLLQ